MKEGPITAVVTIVSICLVTVLFKGILGRLSILIGVLIGYVAAILQGQVDFSTVSKAAWIGFPEFQAPSFAPRPWACSCRSCSSWSPRMSAT